MSKEINRMINQLNVQLAIARNDAIVQQRAADAREQEYNKRYNEWQAQYAEIQAQNVASAEAAQTRFEEQLLQSQQASDATIAGLEKLLLDQQETSAAQAAQFAEQSALAEARYQDQLKRASRIQSAYVPANQPTAMAPTVGDSRQAVQPSSQRRSLSQLSIVNNNAGTGTKAQQLSGLQIA